MVRKLNHRFKHILIMNIVFGSVVMTETHAPYDVKMLFSMHF